MIGIPPAQDNKTLKTITKTWHYSVIYHGKVTDYRQWKQFSKSKYKENSQHKSSITFYTWLYLTINYKYIFGTARGIKIEITFCQLNLSTYVLKMFTILYQNIQAHFHTETASLFFAIPTNKIIGNPSYVIDSCQGKHLSLEKLLEKMFQFNKCLDHFCYFN